jgi:hypothetical protein
MNNDDKYINRMRANKPALQHPDELKNSILASIEKIEASQKQVKAVKRMSWSKLAATFLLLVGLGNLGWQEITTWSSVNQLQVNNHKTAESTAPIPRCQQNLRKLIDKIGIVPIRQFKPGYMIRISMADIARLQNTRSPYLTEAMLFLNAIEKYYPDEYLRFMISGETWLPVSQITHDKRFCDLMDK